MKNITECTYVSDGEDAHETDNAHMSAQVITCFFFGYLIACCLLCVFYVVYSVCGSLAKKSS